VEFVSPSNFVPLSTNALPNYVLGKNTTSNEIAAAALDETSEIMSGLTAC
jgi:hypothetical protein